MTSSAGAGQEKTKCFDRGSLPVGVGFGPASQVPPHTSGLVLLAVTAVLAVDQQLFWLHPYRSEASHLLPSPPAHLLQFLEPSLLTSSNERQYK